VTRLGIIAAVAIALTLTGCGDSPPTARQLQASNGAKRAEAAIANSGSNAEQDNIDRRLRLTSQPGLLGFIVLMNEAGQPVMYTGVKGKVTSSGKRLSKPYEAVCCDGAYRPAPSDEGAWGSSDEYIYFWTTDGQYMQWNGKYLYSNSPIRLATEPLVVSIGAPAQPEPNN
jgi:hypothetical protein